MRAIDFKLNRILPESMRRDRFDLGKKGIEELVAELARNPPENYADILHAIGTLGRNAAYAQGNTVTLQDSKQVVDTKRYYQLMDAEIEALEKERDSGDITDTEFTRLRNDVYVKYSDEIGDVTLGNALKSGNNYAKAVASGARGNSQNLKALISTPGVFQDAKGNVIPLFVRNSFAEGVRPADSLAGSYGARAAVTSTKKATAKGGDLLKLMTQAGANVTITEKDCGVENGIALDPDDPSIRRRVLAADTGDLKAGTVVDKRVARQLRKGGKKVVVRSVNTCQSEVGVCAKCAGLDAEGRFPKLGTALGTIEASGVGEPLVQGALSSKRTAGAAEGKKSYSGFDWVSQFMQVPSEFKDEAAMATEDGIVEKITEAPQGGYNITINGKDIHARHGFDVEVKAGQEVEAGDQLSDGLLNPARVVQYKGLGAGREYYINRLQKMLQDSGQKGDRRSIEVIAKSVLSSYRANDPDWDSDFLPDDVVWEGKINKRFKPAKDTQSVTPKQGRGHYLQKPILHYTVGTKVTKAMQKDLDEMGISTVDVSAQKPWFTGEMQRVRAAAHNNRDWMAALSTSYLKKQFEEGAHRGDVTNVESNHHYAPRLAKGDGFGQNIENTGKF